ncbi:glycosyltransferase [Spirosoma rigui]|uniref:glycosyltransferase n=1 Tax=Spirosoma rigui TaxID=564064 RepID=UPI0014732042|nr:glycosyltransferase [Spirosoma rigui]
MQTDTYGPVVQPLISIIITILNGEKSITNCLRSIVEQNFVDYELVVVDGGSIDRTLSIINESHITNKTVRVSPGIGLYAGLNAGIGLAKGHWLYFMGCDDELYDSNTLQKVADAIKSKQKDVEVIAGNVQYLREGFVFRPKLGSPYLLHYKVHHQGMFYQRSVFEELMYDEDLSVSSDYKLNLKLALKKTPHQYIDAIICNFGEDGISNTQIKRSSREIHDIHGKLFTGLARPWVVNYFKFQRLILLTRRRLNLVNLKSRMKRFMGGKT